MVTPEFKHMALLEPVRVQQRSWVARAKLLEQSLSQLHATDKRSVSQHSEKCTKRTSHARARYLQRILI